MIIFTNGCFDEIHIGHIRLLRYCHDLCLRESPFGFNFIVGLNSDESIKRLKGPDRPLYPLKYRIEVLESIYYVNWVEVFEEDTPIELIRRIKPDIIVKGGDYKPEDVVGYGLAKVIIYKGPEWEEIFQITSKRHEKKSCGS